MTLSERRILAAIWLMKRGSPLPVDLEAKLIEEDGVDVAALDEKHREYN